MSGGEEIRSLTSAMAALAALLPLLLMIATQSRSARGDLFGERPQGEIRRIFQLDTPVNRVPVLILCTIGIRRTPWLCSNYGGFVLTVGFRTPAAICLNRWLQTGYSRRPGNRRSVQALLRMVELGT